MRDSLAITAQAIPFLNDFKNFTYLCFIIMHRKDNTLSAILQKKTDALPSESVSTLQIKFKKISNKILYYGI